MYDVRQKDICRCLDSIYSQGVDASQFEVICVDDHSPNENTSKYVMYYSAQNYPPD